MAITAATVKSWSLNSYSASTWTTLVTGTASGETVKAIVITNNSGSPADVQLRVTDSGSTEQAIILPATTFAAGSSQVLDVEILNLTASQKLQIYSTTTSPDFYASGVTYA